MLTQLEGRCYPVEVESYIQQLRGEIANFTEARAMTVDDRQRAKFANNRAALESALKWLPLAADIPVAWVRFVCKENRKVKLTPPGDIRHYRLPEVADQCVGRKIQFHRYRFDTNNPIEIARIRYQIKLVEAGAEPAGLQEDHSVNLQATRMAPNEFLMIMPAEQADQLRREGKILPDYS